MIHREIFMEEWVVNTLVSFVCSSTPFMSHYVWFIYYASIFMINQVIPVCYCSLVNDDIFLDIDGQTLKC
jgi:hypothetical protein